MRSGRNRRSTPIARWMLYVMTRSSKFLSPDSSTAGATASDYSSPMPPVFTAGHSTRPIEELLALLAEHGIRTLVDVRRFPGSRRHPQYSRDALAASLAGAGLQYIHEPGLGGRRAARPASPHTAWRVDAFRGYADYMETPEFQASLDRLIERAEEETTAILCAEAVPWHCH